MRRKGTRQLLIVAMIAAITTGCATSLPVTAGTSQSGKSTSPSPAPAAAMYDVEQAQALMLTAADTSDLAGAELAIAWWSSSTSTDSLSDKYSERISTTVPWPEACGPVYWLAVTGKAEMNSTDPFVSGPDLVGVASHGSVSNSTNASQGVRIFATPEAAQAHFDGIASALESCPEYQVDGQDGSFTFEEVALEPMSADTIHLRQTLTKWDIGSGVAATTPTNSDQWVFRKGNLLLVLDGQREGGDLTALAGILKSRLDSMGGQG
jgi:hypothetical protein